MRIDNRHARTIALDAVEAGKWLDSLASEDDQLWPRSWPPMVLDQGLRVGSRGGHGPVRYAVEAYVPGKSVAFAFDRSIGLHGTHRFDLVPVDGGVRFEHRIDAQATGTMRLAWPLAVRWLHDALIEDAFDAASTRVGTPCRTPWSLWVRMLRRVLR